MNYRSDDTVDARQQLKDDGDLDNTEKFIRTSSKIISLTTDIKLALGNNRFVCYNLYQGKMKFHIRQFETLHVDVLIPSKQGLCMSLDCFTQFLTKISEIDERVTDLMAKRWVDSEIYIDENVIASIRTGFDGVYLRKVQVGNLKVNRASTGIALRLQEWDLLKICLKELFEMKPELRMHREWTSKIAVLSKFGRWELLYWLFYRIIDIQNLR